MVEPLGFWVVAGAVVAGVGLAVVAPASENMVRMVRVVRMVLRGRRGKKKWPTSIVPHTAATTGGGESGADLKTCHLTTKLYRK